MAGIEDKTYTVRAYDGTKVTIVASGFSRLNERDCWLSFTDSQDRLICYVNPEKVFHVTVQQDVELDEASNA